MNFPSEPWWQESAESYGMTCRWWKLRKKDDGSECCSSFVTETGCNNLFLHDEICTQKLYCARKNVSLDENKGMHIRAFHNYAFHFDCMIARKIETRVNTSRMTRVLTLDGATEFHEALNCRRMKIIPTRETAAASINSIQSFKC